MLVIVLDGAQLSSPENPGYDDDREHDDFLNWPGAATAVGPPWREEHTMKNRRWAALLLGMCVVWLTGVAPAQVVLQTDDLRLEIAANGQLGSLTARTTGKEYAWTAAPLSIAAVYRGGETAIASQADFAENEAPVYRGGRCFPASAVSLVGDRLTIRFAQADVTATYRVAVRPQYLAFELLQLEGDPVDRIDLLQLRLKRLPYLGPWIDVAYDDRFGVCLCGGNPQTNAGLSPYPEYVELRAVATRDVALVGTTAVLFACPEPQARFLDHMEIVERDFRMPAGARHRRSPVQKESYLWCSPTPADVDQYVALAQRAGLRTVLYSYTAFTQGAGHFLFNAKYPRGMADLKHVADRIRAAGLHVGLHIHYSKAVRTDGYVTPVPDNRFHKVRTFTLAGPLDERSDTIAVNENPSGCTRDQDRRILQLGQELVAYTDYTTVLPYRFTGCQRGHLQTAARGHAAGSSAGLWDVDDWVIFIRFDQNTDIQDEAARRIAEIFRATGPYDVVYFDGAEDVHDPFWYHVANAQQRVYRLLDPPPPVCEAAMSTHFSWHMMTRGNAYDVAGRHIKAFTRQVTCRTAPLRALEFTRINFGWIFGFYRDLSPDTLEYVLSRGAAWDCPFSIRATPAEVAANPRADDCLDVIRLWETARIEGRLADAQHAMLRTVPPEQYRFIKTWHAVFLPEFVDAWSRRPFQDQEHHLFVNERGQYELVPIREIGNVADGQIKAYVFQREKQPGDTYVLVWACRGERQLDLPVPPERLTVMRPFGQRLPITGAAGNTTVPVSSRRYLHLPGTSAEQAVKMLLR
jgi:hypothetical protein